MCLKIHTFLFHAISLKTSDWDLMAPVNRITIEKSNQLIIIQTIFKNYRLISSHWVDFSRYPADSCCHSYKPILQQVFHHNWDIISLKTTDGLNTLIYLISKQMNPKIWSIWFLRLKNPMWFLAKTALPTPFTISRLFMIFSVIQLHS